MDRIDKYSDLFYETIGIVILAHLIFCKPFNIRGIKFGNFESLAEFLFSMLYLLNLNQLTVMCTTHGERS